MSIPRPEYPKPQFERKNWLNLNGEWDFTVDNGLSGEARRFYTDFSAYDKKIIVPFCLESPLSGLGIRDFTYGVWYKRTVTLTAEQAAKRVALHVGAADYKTKLWVNGEKIGEHKGGYVSFMFDISAAVKEGENTVVIFCEDDTRDPMIPRGKQCEEYYSRSCDYTRTTGIWQTVWLEFTEKTYIKNVKFRPDAASQSVNIEAFLEGKADFSAKVTFEGKDMGEFSVTAAAGVLNFNIALKEEHLWELGAGRLYDVAFTFGKDEVKSYFGLRSAVMDGYKFRLNGKSVFQRTVLDQGFYPDGIYTAPTDEALKHDIELSMDFGFNGARLHQKVFEERFLYHADKMGYMVWGEYPNWGLDHSRPESVYGILPEWLSEVERDFNHPSIIGWCPFNETWDVCGRRQYNELISLVYRATKAADPARICIDTSGNYHVETDIFDLHDYDQNPETLQERLAPFVTGPELNNHCNDRQAYKDGQPVFMSEYGGIKWSPVEGNARDVAWGYGNAPQSEEEYKARYKGLTDVLLDHPKIFGFCYTQLTDVEQEQNGCYRYDRTAKFDTAFFREVNKRKAAIEEE